MFRDDTQPTWHRYPAPELGTQGTASAQIYSPVETAKANGQEPYTWLPDAQSVNAVAVELLARDATVKEANLFGIFDHVGFMGRLLKQLVQNDDSVSFHTSIIHSIYHSAHAVIG